MKVFNEKETAEILKRAAVKSHHTPADESTGLTLQELEQIASESGINPVEISKAVEEIAMQSHRPEQTFWGGPFSFYEQVQIDHEISSVEWEAMLISIREFFQSKGEVSARESVFEWSSPWGTTNAAHVTALKDQGKTKVSVSWTGPLTALPFYVPIPLVGIASLFFASDFLGLSSVPGLAFVALSMGVTFAAGRWALRRHMENGFSKLSTLSAKLQSIGRKDQKTSIVREDTPGKIVDQHVEAESRLNLEQDIEQGGSDDLASKTRGRSRE